jgi:cysteine peptidase B
MKSVLLLCLLLGLAIADIRQQFIEFQRQYKKVYSSHEEFQRRFAIFQDNMKWAQELNKQNPMAKFGATRFSDLSREEFANFYLMPNFNATAYVAPPTKAFAERVPTASNVDWRTKGCITPVYDQGQCGSCWAFSATETIESYWFLSGNSLRRLSMEQIVDCDTTDDGCGGGFPQNAYSYVQNAGGIDSYTSYPYTAGNGQAGSCQANSQNMIADVANSQTISGESGLAAQLNLDASQGGGPVSVCVDASSWQNYQGGILTSCGNNVDHCVQLVGYQAYNTPAAAWLVRNSWATSWGENGYIRIAIGQDLCSIGDYATVVTTSAPNGN